MEPIAQSLLRRLDAYRLDRDWTFKQLAEAMARAGVQMSPRTLHYLVKQKGVHTNTQDRIAHKLRKYMRHVARSKKDAARVRTKRSAARESTTTEARP